MTLILALSLLAQPTDADFSVAVEQFIHSTGTVHEYEQVMSRRSADVLRGLACGHYGCRENSSALLPTLGPEALRAAFWGTRSKDAEVAARCRPILRTLTPCGHCGGQGECPRMRQQLYNCVPCKQAVQDSDASWESYWRGRCLTCDGVGSLMVRP